MEINILHGEYLAPEIEVADILSRMALCDSGYIEEHTYTDPWAA